MGGYKNIWLCFLLPFVGACAERVHYEESPLDTASEPGSELDDDVSEDETVDDTDTDEAQVISVDFPSDLDCGESATALVVVENTGTTTWSRNEGYKLGAVGDEDPLFDSGDVRVWLDEAVLVLPGEQHRFEIPLVGSDAEGTELTDWQMVHESVQWFGESTEAEVSVSCDDGSDDDTGSQLSLPDMWHVVDELAAEHPEMLAGSCLDDGGSWDFMDTLVDRLRETDERWGYNWKRGEVGVPSEDCVDYHYGSGEREGSTDVYIIDVIVGHCGVDPEPGWLDQTEATADAGTIGIWTGRGRF